MAGLPLPNEGQNGVWNIVTVGLGKIKAQDDPTLIARPRRPQAGAFLAVERDRVAVLHSHHHESKQEARYA